MLRISIEEKQDAVILRLEGRLISTWVPDVKQCWRNVFETLGKRSVQSCLFPQPVKGACRLRLENRAGVV